jgi:hypothetical protein
MMNTVIQIRPSMFTRSILRHSRNVEDIHGYKGYLLNVGHIENDLLQNGVVNKIGRIHQILTPFAVVVSSTHSSFRF